MFHTLEAAYKSLVPLGNKFFLRPAWISGAQGLFSERRGSKLRSNDFLLGCTVKSQHAEPSMGFDNCEDSAFCCFQGWCRVWGVGFA